MCSFIATVFSFYLFFIHSSISIYIRFLVFITASLSTCSILNMRKDTAYLLVNPVAAFIGLSVLLLICQYSQLTYTSIKSVLSGFELVVFESRKMLFIPKKRISSVLLVIRASTSFSVMILSLFFIFSFLYSSLASLSVL